MTNIHLVTLTRRLVRGVRVASLATAHGSEPYVALVTPACTAELSMLLLLSGLSAHTRHLRANPVCALLCIEDGPETSNPQTWPRVSVSAHAELEDTPATRARYLARHPYASLYAGLPDFAIWRLRPTRAHLVGGFAQAATLQAADLLPNPAQIASFKAAEPNIMAHCNTDHPDAMEAIGHWRTGRALAWRLHAVDPDGCDLIAPDAAARAPWVEPATDPGELRGALITLTRQARAARGGG